MEKLGGGILPTMGHVRKEVKLIILGQEGFWAYEEGCRANGSHNHEEELHAVEDTGRGNSHKDPGGRCLSGQSLRLA